MFTTQLLVKGLAENARDGIVKRVDAKALDTLLVAFNPIRGSRIGELAATFDLVLGKTLEELEDGTLGGGVAMSEIQRQTIETTIGSDTRPAPTA